MTSEKLESVYRSMIPAAKSFVENGKQVVPVIFAVKPDGDLALIQLPGFRTDAEKHTLYRAAGEYLRETLHATGAVLINESWMVSEKGGVDLKIRPSAHPNRRECIIAVLCDYNGATLYVLPFERGESGAIKWEAEERHTGSGVECNLFTAFRDGVQ